MKARTTMRVITIGPAAAVLALIGTAGADAEIFAAYPPAPPAVAPTPAAPAEAPQEER